jgi:signal transduction histidine kinase
VTAPTTGPRQTQPGEHGRPAVGGHGPLSALRRVALGLRTRLLGALLLTSVVTLGVAALALLPPLEHRLSSAEESSTRQVLTSSKREFENIPVDHHTRKPNEEVLGDVAQRVRGRVGGAAVTVLDEKLHTVYSTGEPTENLPPYYLQAQQALKTDQGQSSLQGGQLIVAMPLRIGPSTQIREGSRLVERRPPRFVVVMVRHLQYIDSAAGVVRKAALEAAAAGLGIALLLGIWLTSTLLRRLRRLRDATRELEQQGTDAQLPVDEGYDEVSELARAFQSMRSRLAHQEEARRAFVATASHELRTPLASLHGMLELIEEDLDDEHLDLEDARERAEQARVQAQRLSQLATDLLDLSRLDAQVDLRSEPLELSELCRAVAAEFERQAAERMVRLDVDRPPGPCWVLADPGAVARIVRILIDNALRLTPPGSSVELRQSALRGRGQVLVRDHGPGVPAGERERIFERFQRGSWTGGRAGFGLGLAIGRELAERMGGSLTLLPDEPEPGARFLLELPAASVEAPAGERQPDVTVRSSRVR